MPQKTGIAQISVHLHKCVRTQAKFPAKLPQAIADAVTAGKITSAEASTLNSFLGNMPGATEIIRKASGY